ncbi:MAG TPA: histidine phosphatase family protein [Anaerolineales bacterium]|nr:histidine phosphatase family protein [Anaerolineales bacterium]
MQLYFIRHAQSQNNALYDQTGSSNGRHSDPEITAAGWKQAQILADFLTTTGTGAPSNVFDPHNRMGFQFTHLYCSLMVRSIQTGRVMSKALNLPLVALADLHEGGGIFHKDETSGELSGLPGYDEAYFQQHYPELVLPTNMNKNGWWNRPFEDYAQRSERAARVLKLLLSLHASSEDRIALISHGGFYNYFLGEILGISSNANSEREPDAPEVWLTMNNVAITRMDWTPEETRLIYHNRVDFLPTELIT